MDVDPQGCHYWAVNVGVDGNSILLGVQTWKKKNSMDYNGIGQMSEERGKKTKNENKNLGWVLKVYLQSRENTRNSSKPDKEHQIHKLKIHKCSGNRGEFLAPLNQVTLTLPIYQVYLPRLPPRLNKDYLALDRCFLISSGNKTTHRELK